MEKSSTHLNEENRLEALKKLQIKYTEKEERFEKITRIARNLFNVQTAFISLVEKDRVWFKSTSGIDVKDERREVSINNYAVGKVTSNQLQSRLLEIENLHSEEQFDSRHYISRDCTVQHFMCFVVQSEDNYNLGTLGIADSKRRSFSSKELNLFCGLGLLTEKELQNSSNNGAKLVDRYTEINKKEVFPALYLNNLLALSNKVALIETKFTKILKEFNIKYIEWRILNEIIQYMFVSPQHISHNLVISPSLVSNYLEVLENKGLIVRKHLNKEEGDRRIVHLECTDTGKEVWRNGFLSTDNLDIEGVQIIAESIR